MEVNLTPGIDRGAVALALPGLLCDAQVFAGLDPFVPHLRMAPDYGDCDSLEAMAGRVLGEAPPRMVLIGHSMGGRVALEVFRQAPDRVAGLALVSTGIHSVRPGEAEKRHALRDIGRKQGIVALVDAWLPPMVAPARREDAMLMGRLRRMCIAAGLTRFEAQIQALLTRPPVETLLSTVACPTLVACGEHDAWSPPDQAGDIAGRVKDALLAIVPRAGHMLPAEEPAAFGALVRDWIDGRRGAGQAYS